MRFFLFVISFFFLSFLSLKSQTKELKGEVKDASGGLSGVVVTVITESENDVLSYAITDNEGKFVLKNVDTAKGIFVRARLMGYATQKIPIDGNKTDYEFLLTEESIQLNEVLIKALKITGSGDTTRYLASSFAKENDITLGDVLKRMPGIQVSDQGRIKYQGKDISDFYVEGSNIMGGKYPIAENSIHQTDVGSVEVIENHQSVKLFEDILFSNNTALNITLKERAKNRWVGLLNLGGGVPGQWSADVNAMRFAPKVKMLNTYKGNNTGNDVSSIGKTIFNLSDETEKDAREIISMRSARNPFLEDRKTLFNKSHLLSLNNQVPLNKTFMFTPQLDIGRSTFDNNILEEKNYFLEGGKTFNISTQETALLKQWDISPTMRLDANTRKLYFNNELSSNIVRKENDAFVTGTYPNRENGSSDYVNIRNDLNAMFRIGQKVIGVKSVNSWSRRPQDMDIVQNNTKLHQHIRTSVFNSKTSTTQSFVFGRATLSLEEGYSFSRQRLQSTLSGLQYANGYGDFENDFDYRKA